jgi:predicted Zn-dependent protease
MPSALSRHDLLAGLASGRVAARDLAQLSADDVTTVLDLADVQTGAGRHDNAARLYAFLVALEPDQPDHLLRLADAHVQAGHERDAVDTLTRYLDGQQERTDAGRAWALLVRADLLEAADPTVAERDRTAAKALAKVSPEARAVVEQPEGDR